MSEYFPEDVNRLQEFLANRAESEDISDEGILEMVEEVKTDIELGDWSPNDGWI